MNKEDMILERDELEIRIHRYYNHKHHTKNLFELCERVDRLYHMTRYIRSLDKEIACTK